MTAFDDLVTQSQGSELRANGIDVLQLNVGSVSYTHLTLPTITE